MKLKFKVCSALTVGLMLATLSPAFAKAARKKSAASSSKGIVDPDAPTPEEVKVLGWGPVKTPIEVDKPTYLVRGVVMDLTKAEGGKDSYQLKILPIEAVQNFQRHITKEHFQNGLDLVLNIPKSKLKEISKGAVIEYNQHYTEHVSQQVGGASFVNYTFHQDIQGYPVSAAAYLEKPDFYPIQYINAMKGLDAFNGKIDSQNDLKAALDAHASNKANPELQTAAKALYARYFNAEPTGQCKADAAAQKFVCP